MAISDEIKEFLNIRHKHSQLGTLIKDAESAAPGAIALADTHILVGNGSGVAADVAVSGDATLANTGALTVGNAAVIGKVLTGFVAGAGTVAATDTILQAFNKDVGNLAAKVPDKSLLLSGKFTTLGGDANESITAVGVLATDLVMVQAESGAAYVVSSVGNAGVIDVVMSADPGAGVKLNWLVYR
jgi:hypothetical protein